MYKTILKDAKAEIEIKKSIFIGHAFFVKSEEEALEILGGLKKNTGLQPTTAMPT